MMGGFFLLFLLFLQSPLFKYIVSKLERVGSRSVLKTKVEGIQNLGKPADVILDHFQMCSKKVSRGGASGANRGYLLAHCGERRGGGGGGGPPHNKLLSLLH